MKSQFSLFDLLILIGIIQGVITSILLIRTKKNPRSNIFLALALLSFCFLSSKTLLHTLNLWDHPIFRFFPNGVELAIAPLIYFYIKSLVNPSFSFKNKYWIHFIPFFLSQTYAFIVYISALSTNDLYEKDSIAMNLGFNQVKQLEEYLLLISLSFYLFYGFKELNSYKKWLGNTTSDSSFPDFNWLKSIFQLSAVIGLFLLVNNSLDIFYELKYQTTLHWDLLILFIAFLIYYLGFKGYLQPDYAFSKDDVIESKSLAAKSTTKSNETIEQLEKVMAEDKLFLNPKLNIYELAEVLETSQKSLSVAINHYYQMNFRDFINNYRVEEIKSKLNDKDYGHMSMLGIALECGFNSEASFYRIFKKHTGVSPREFIQEN